MKFVFDVVLRFFVWKFVSIRLRIVRFGIRNLKIVIVVFVCVKVFMF